MDQLNIAQAFIEQIQEERQLCVLESAFQRSLNALGFRYFACGSHVDPLRPRQGVMLITYPPEWVRSFSEMRVQEIDPVFQHANRSSLPFFWDSEEFRARLTAAQRSVLAEASRHGVAHGYTIPIHSPRSPFALRASCSVVPDSPRLDDRAYFAVQLMACYLFDAAARIVCSDMESVRQPLLSRRERECLQYVAQGKDDWAIGRLLSLSGFTVHTHIENAKRKLDVATRMQAVVQALATQQVSFGDVIRGLARRADDLPPRYGRRKRSIRKKPRQRDT